MKRPTKTAAFEVFQDQHEAWRWRLIAANGEIVCQSEAYATRSSARRACGRLALIATSADQPASRR